MPRPATIDWKPIKRDYVAGFTPTQLEAKYGIANAKIRVQASRKRWLDLRKANPIPPLAKTDLLAVKSTVEASVQRIHNDLVARYQLAMSADVVRRVEEYPSKFNPRSRNEMLTYERGMDVLGNRARKTFGLDQQGASGQGCTVNIQVLNGAEPIRTGVTVDVESGPGQPIEPPACGLDTPTSSVPVPTSESQTPQESGNA